MRFICKLILDNIQMMTEKQHRPTPNTHNKFLSQHVLFKKNSSQPKNNPFQTLHYKVDPFPNCLHDKGKGTPPTTPAESDKLNAMLGEGKVNGNKNGNKNNCEIGELELQKVKKSPLKRAFSSNKFDLLASKKEGRRKAKKTKPNIFEYARALKGENTSKKSTDESSSAPMETLKAQNQQFLEIIKSQEAKMRKLEHAILEQKKRHQLQKHLYTQNIQKLKKLAALQSPTNPILEDSDNENHDCDSLSIESN